jgi:hypothetical protein
LLPPQLFCSFLSVATRHLARIVRRTMSTELQDVLPSNASHTDRGAVRRGRRKLHHNELHDLSFIHSAVRLTTGP